MVHKDASQYSSVISKPKPSKEWPVQVLQAPGSLDCSLERRPAVPGKLQGLHSAHHLETVLRSDLLGDASVWQPASWRSRRCPSRKQFNHPFIKLSYRNHTRGFGCQDTPWSTQARLRDNNMSAMRSHFLTMSSVLWPSAWLLSAPKTELPWE